MYEFIQPAGSGCPQTSLGTVDEAGQVSIANLVATGTAARNIILVGDQMQLPQPVQGVHPGDTGLSTLDYLLEGGQAPIQKVVTVPKGARRTVQVFNPADPGGIGRAVSDPVSRGVSVRISTASAKGVVAEVKILKGTIEPVQSLLGQIEDVRALHELGTEADDPGTVLARG